MFFFFPKVRALNETGGSAIGGQIKRKGRNERNRERKGRDTEKGRRREGRIKTELKRKREKGKEKTSALKRRRKRDRVSDSSGYAA